MNKTIKIIVTIIVVIIVAIVIAVSAGYFVTTGALSPAPVQEKIQPKSQLDIRQNPVDCAITVPARKPGNTIYGNEVRVTPKLQPFTRDKLPKQSKRNFLYVVKTTLSLCPKAKEFDSPSIFVLLLKDSNKQKKITAILAKKNKIVAIKKVERALQQWAGIPNSKLCKIVQDNQSMLGLQIRERPQKIPAGFKLIEIPAGKNMRLVLNKRVAARLLEANMGEMEIVLDWYWHKKRHAALIQPLVISMDKKSNIHLSAGIRLENKGLKRLSELYTLPYLESNLPKILPEKLPGLTKQEAGELRLWILKWVKITKDTTATDSPPGF